MKRLRKVVQIVFPKVVVNNLTILSLVTFFFAFSILQPTRIMAFLSRSNDDGWWQRGGCYCCEMMTKKMMGALNFLSFRGCTV